MTKISFAFLGDCCERRIAKSSELAVESYFQQSYTGFKTAKHLLNYWFFQNVLWSKNCLFFTTQSIYVMNQRSPVGFRKLAVSEITRQRESWSGRVWLGRV